MFKIFQRTQTIITAYARISVRLHAIAVGSEFDSNPLKVVGFSIQNEALVGGRSVPKEVLRNGPKSTLNPTSILYCKRRPWFLSVQQSTLVGRFS